MGVFLTVTLYDMHVCIESLPIRWNPSIHVSGTNTQPWGAEFAWKCVIYPTVHLYLVLRLWTVALHMYTEVHA